MKILLNLIFFCTLPAYGLASDIPSNLIEKLNFNGVNILPANTVETKKFKGAVTYMLSEAIKGRAKTNISWFNIQKLVNEISEVNIYVNDGTPLLSSDQRYGSVYFSDYKAIVFNRSLIKKLIGDAERPVLEMGSETLMIHELIGALGYPDKNYEISTYLWTRSLSDDYSEDIFKTQELQLEKLLLENSRLINKPSIQPYESGSTGVGGGGDPGSISLKIAALVILGQNKSRVMEYYSLSETRYLEILNAVLGCRIEPGDSNKLYTDQLLSDELILNIIRDRDNELKVIINTSRLLKLNDDFALATLEIGLELIEAINENL